MILIKDKLTKNNGLTANEFLVYLGLLMLIKKGQNTYYITVRSLTYTLSGVFPGDPLFIKIIRDGFSGLSNKNFITIIKMGRRDEYLVDLSKVIKDNSDKKDYYTLVGENDIQKLIQSTENYYIKTISLIRFYIYVLSTVNKGDKDYKGVGFTSLKNMALTMGINSKTASTYLHDLMDLELLYIYKPQSRVIVKDNVVFEIGYTYGKYENKDKVIKAGRSHEEEIMASNPNYTKMNKLNGDTTRKLSQQFNFMKKCIDEGKEVPYSEEKLKKIYAAMKKLNEKYEKNRPDRIKDLSIFKEYDFYED